MTHQSTSSSNDYCGNPSPHDAHRNLRSQEVGVCLGYPDPGTQQIWEDADKRLAAEGRRRLLVVTTLDTTHAGCQACDGNGQPTSTRVLRIRLDRLKPTSTGYHYRGMAQ
ncbi:hypothetical protein [Streptomyces halstedii]|uniref:Uncharacterized protein n=1 Tax=Streptomyces halstedii TaxID=1944 RepID=A0A6N9UDF4_STRHA|nr:hypothetical protein [Streptomyces halstedii]NEA18965.1 hypothetical protein [Streptomyces halstedii]